ncbi:GNAT family N-acetyltransferase [Enterovibrio norvegicus]|uniref:GNAT family N-acetyltransferase n=1 Tax=Enterovibrio norvegicus TaxID=188144 RepID=UPI000C859CEE|nr:GNAT family N-acetyltransferase [Enterovibrio norvegicus]PMN70036.1 GNAT family N-acetyltransferase [Enterovibrio norvegicus]
MKANSDVEFVTLNRDEPFYQDALDLRFTLFFEPVNLSRDVLFDDAEASSNHLALTREGTLVAYLRLTETSENHYQLSQMVVTPKDQGKGLGHRLVTEAIQYLRARSATDVTLSARLHAIRLYRSVGFIVSGDTYLSKRTGVEHINMHLKLT